jgi:hypothetical protein
MIYFSDFGVSGPTTDVVFAVQDFDTGTSTGAQTFSSSTITGVTPKAALVLSPFHNPANDPGETAAVGIGVGLADASADINARGFNRDNVSATAAFRTASATKGYEVFNNTGSSIKQADVTMASGGLTFTFTTNSSPSLRGSYVAFAGADVSAKVGTIALGTGTSAIDVTGPGFQPDVVILIGTGRLFDANLTNPFVYNFGFCAYEGGSYAQQCVMWAESHALADSRPFQSLLDDCAGGEIGDTNGALTYKLTVGGFDANGFDVTPSASAGSDTVGYLALKFAGRQHKIVAFDTPTTTGSHSITGAGFTPRFALVVLTNLEAINSHPGTTSDNQSGLAICTIGSDEQWSTSWRINAAEATTDTASQISNVALMGASATDCDAIKATFSAWTTDGVTLSYSATQGTAKKGFILFVE